MVLAKNKCFRWVFFCLGAVGILKIAKKKRRPSLPLRQRGNSKKSCIFTMFLPRCCRGALTETMCLHECVLPLRPRGGKQNHMTNVVVAPAPSREIPRGFPGSSCLFTRFLPRLFRGALCFHECVLPLRPRDGQRNHMPRVFAAPAPSREVLGGSTGSAPKFSGNFTVISRGIPRAFPGNYRETNRGSRF